MDVTIFVNLCEALNRNINYLTDRRIEQTIQIHNLHLQ